VEGGNTVSKDKVMSPKQSSRAGGLKYGSTSAVKGPNPSLANLTPYNRKSK